jgi:hypothetical protein
MSIRIVCIVLAFVRCCWRSIRHRPTRSQLGVEQLYFGPLARSPKQTTSGAQLLRAMERLEIDPVINSCKDQTRHYVDTLVSGYFMQVAHKEGEKASYLTIKGNQVRPTCDV